MPYYQRAQTVFEAGPLDYGPDAWESEYRRRWPLDPLKLETGMFQFSSANKFLETYRDELVNSENITVYTHASVVEILTSDNFRTATELRVARLGAGDIRVSAKRFILAAGGFENARLLLMSNRQQLGGVGNQNDVVGRYYHDHPQGRIGYLTPRDPKLFSNSSLYDMQEVNGTPVMGYLKLSETLLRKEKLLNINCFLFPKPDQRKDRAIQSFNLLRDSKFHQKRKHGFPSVFPKSSATRHVLNVFRGLDYVAKMAYMAKTGRQFSEYGLCAGGWSRLDKLPRRFSRMEVWHGMEQTPHPDNRVVLGNKTDIFGCPQLKLQWHWPQHDINQILRAQTLIARELERSGIGRLELEHDADGLPNLERPVGSHHLMGTTRMHVNPEFGVVDANCRVHGMTNLFIAGSSTFPTGGYANPTLTIVAMALRLGDFIKSEIAAEAAARWTAGKTLDLQGSLVT
jgi:choline dehydrogenase-like flavoprotein